MKRQLFSLSFSLTLSATAPATAEPPSADEPTADEPTADEPSADEPTAAGNAADADDGTDEAEPSIQPTKRREKEARAAFRKGDRLYLEGDYPGAIEAFEKAYALSGRIEMLFNLANAHERLGNYDKASVALRGYIPHSPEQHRTALERRLARFEDQAKKQREQEQETAEAVKTLKENPRPFPVERALGVGLLTLGTASVLTGVGFAISASGARRDLNDDCVDGASGRLCTSDAEMTLGRDKAHSFVADATLIGGAILAGAGVYFVVRANRKERKDVELRVGLAPDRVLLGGTF